MVDWWYEKQNYIDSNYLCWWCQKPLPKFDEKDINKDLTFSCTHCGEDKGIYGFVIEQDLTPRKIGNCTHCGKEIMPNMGSYTLEYEKDISKNELYCYIGCANLHYGKG